MENKVYKILNDGAKILKEESETSDLTRWAQKFKTDLPMHILNTQLLAKLTWVKYDALVKEGFTKEQALLLCK